MSQYCSQGGDFLATQQYSQVYSDNPSFSTPSRAVKVPQVEYMALLTGTQHRGFILPRSSQQRSANFCHSSSDDVIAFGTHPNQRVNSEDKNLQWKWERAREQERELQVKLLSQLQTVPNTPVQSQSQHSVTQSKTSYPGSCALLFNFTPSPHASPSSSDSVCSSVQVSETNTDPNDSNLLATVAARQLLKTTHCPQGHLLVEMRVSGNCSHCGRALYTDYGAFCIKCEYTCCKYCGCLTTT